MREQLAEWLNYYRYGRIILWKDLDESAKEFVRTGADQILTLITERIKKIENPCLYERDKEAAESMRQAVLKEMHERTND